MNSAPERAADYHADQGDSITLSSTIARLLISKTPAHAKAAHPRLDPEAPHKTSDSMDMGTAVHQLLLRDDRVDVLDFADFRTKDARAARDESRAAGRVPMLAHKWSEAGFIANCVREQIVALNLEPVPFTEGTAEHVIRWNEDGVACRAMLDWLRDDITVIDDLKTTNDASFRGFQRKVWTMRYDIQAAFYLRAVRSRRLVDVSGYTEDGRGELLPGGDPIGFRWVAVETEYPYLVTVHELSRSALDNADARVDEAIDIWRRCLAEDDWPGYRGYGEVGPVPWERDSWADVDVEDVPF